MTLDVFFNTVNLENSFIVGFYGGGNFGDELLLEVLLNKLKLIGVKQMSFFYIKPEMYQKYHRVFRFNMVTGKINMIRQMLKSNSIVIGGGGLWGMDVNLNILFLSFQLFLSRYIFGKKVYLIGVGFYDSTNFLGRIAAWFSAKAANQILVRDEESYNNFFKFNKNVSRDTDLAYFIKDFNLSDYDEDAKTISNGLKLSRSMIYITFRAFNDHRGDTYNKIVQQLLDSEPNRNFVISLLQPANEFPIGQSFINKLAKHNNVQILNTECNPMALVRFFQKNSNRFKFITPQFHAILVAKLTSIPFYPLAYDNKVQNILINGNIDPTTIENVKLNNLKKFVKG